MARKPTSFNLDDDVRGYIESEAKAAGISNSEFVTGVMNGLKSGTVGAVKIDTESKSEDELKKEKLAIDIEIKKQIRDSNQLKNDLDKAELRYRDLRNQLLEKKLADKTNGPFIVVAPRVPQGPQELQKEIAKDTASPEPKKRPTSVRELPAGQGLVGCDTCHEVFIFDDEHHGLDDFLDHLKEKHPWRKEQISHNEATQFRFAAERIKKAKEATA